MTHTSTLASTSLRQPLLRLLILGVCIGIVAVASFFHPRAGACGTAHYLTVQMLGGMLASIKEEIWISPYDSAIASWSAIAINVALFVVLVKLWMVKAPERWRTVGVPVLAMLYVASYLFMLPTTSCP
jgi:hypothetical protein